MTTAYLDIETNWDREITVIGIHHQIRGLIVQIGAWSAASVT